MFLTFHNKYPFLLAVYHLAKINREIEEVENRIRIAERLIEQRVLTETPGFYPALENSELKQTFTFFAVAKGSSIPFLLHDGIKVGEQIKRIGFIPEFLVACRTVLPEERIICEHRITIYEMP